MLSLFFFCACTIVFIFKILSERARPKVECPRCSFHETVCYNNLPAVRSIRRYVTMKRFLFAMVVFSLSPAMLGGKVSSERICFLRFDSRKKEKARKSERTSHGLPSGKCFPLPSEATHTVTGDVGRWCWWCRAFFLLWSFLIHSGRWLMVRKWLQRKKPTRCCKSFPLGLGRMDGWGSRWGDNNIEITFFSLLLLLKCFPNLLLVVCAGAAFPFRLLLLYAGLAVETVIVCGGRKWFRFAKYFTYLEESKILLMCGWLCKAN